MAKGNSDDGKKGERFSSLGRRKEKEEESPKKSKAEMKQEAEQNAAESSSTWNESSSTEESSRGAGPSMSESSPPFGWDKVDQQAMYPRAETWEHIDDFKYEVDGVLRREFSIRNPENRERDEAILQLVMKHIDPEDVAEYIVQKRGFDTK